MLPDEEQSPPVPGFLNLLGCSRVTFGGGREPVGVAVPLPQTGGGCMSEEDGFIRAILAAPNDPVPRLIYSDWLEERGDVRAEYLRVLCAVDALAPADETSDTMLLRLEAIQETIDPCWIALMNRGRPARKKREKNGRKSTRGGRRSRREVLEANIGLFLRQYARKAQKSSDPNDRDYSREIEEAVKRMKPEELDRLMRGESDE
jgi:uncharacterized protein (TIGR02996 family)